MTRQFPHYNLDRIISLGYRIKSVIATRFRQWATQRLKEYMIKGFTIDDERLKGNGGKLLDRIRDIKSSESLGFFVIISDRRIWQRFFKKQCCWNASILHGHTKIEKMKLSNQELDNYSDGIDVYYLAENTLYKLETEKNESEKLIDMYIDNEQSLICKKLDDEYRTYHIISKNTDVSNSTSYRWYLSSMKHR